MEDKTRRVDCGAGYSRKADTTVTSAGTAGTSPDGQNWTQHLQSINNIITYCLLCNAQNIVSLIQKLGSNF